MSKPLLSVVIPVYNTGQIASKLIARVLKQKMDDLELILVDDGSTDDSLAHLRGWQTKDKRVKVLAQKNGGPSAARNTGLNKARGEYLMFLDSDDDITPGMIPKMVKRIQKDSADMSVCQLRFNTIKDGRVVSSVDIDKAPIPPQRKDEPKETYIVRLLGIDGRLYHPSNKVFRMDIIRKHKLQFREDLRFGEDLTFNLNYLKHGSNISFVNEPLYIYNFGTGTSVVSKSALVYKNRQTNFEDLLKFAGDNRSQELEDLLGWVRHYWFYSFALAVCDSPLGLREKLSYLSNAIKNEKLTQAKSPKYIGRNKYLTERLIGLAAKTPATLYVFTAVGNSMKNSRLLAGVWRKLATRATKA